MYGVLQPYIDSLVPSRAVFKLTIQGSSYVYADKLYPAAPNPIAGDIISELVCMSFCERFKSDSKSFAVDQNEVFQTTMAVVIDRLARFYITNVNLKKPALSATYKWLYRTDLENRDLSDALVLLVKYIHSFGGISALGVSKVLNQPMHVTNALSVLEALRSKHDR